MSAHHKKIRSALLGASALVSAASLMTAAPALAQSRQYQFDLPAQPLGAALKAYGSMADQPIIFAESLVRDRSAPPVKGDYTAEQGLSMLLAGSGLTAERTPGGVVAIRSLTQDPQGGSAAGGGAEVEGLIVTAQKREENIQDVPIAMSAFSQETLTERQVAGGPDLITQIPNMSFTKTNFTSYSIQIRGIGTQAISATTDPAVAVAFNNTPFVRNHFFEQEFYDLERLEVLRGPQGTLYGRNATAGVVNLISAKPKFTYQAKASVDLSNYSSSRLEGMVNIPLVEDVVAMRLAGAWTKRNGYATNQMTGAQIDGRDLWSARASLRFEPTDGISANFIYEHFEESDDRLRSGKQLCKKHKLAEIAGLPIDQDGIGAGGAFGHQTYFSQGCTRVSLYSPEAFQTPNGFSLPFYGPTGNLGNPIFGRLDPYRSSAQSRDLRVIESSVEPDYRANMDLAELQISVDLTDRLTLNSETSYNADALYSLQDYNRFTTVSQAFDLAHPNAPRTLTPDGEFCDPQLGCSDRLLLVDLSTSESTQFSQEFRLGSDFEGPFNFSLGANYLRHDALDKYYVFINSITLFAAFNATTDANPWQANVTDGSNCLSGPGSVGDTAQSLDPFGAYGISGCIYIDPNPIGSLNDQGRNYFLSLNPYKLVSYAMFGEVYYELTPNLKLTGGLRFTVDRKTAPQIPSWLLATGSTGPTSAEVAGSYPTARTVFQEWREPSGRLALDWKPELSFTDQTLVYASYAHGYKAGGANPPPPVMATYSSLPARELLPDTFDAEFIDAFEVGTKNTLLDGALTLNLTGFYYDYKGYQISEIRNRSAVNANYDAEVWGIELESDWRATESLKLGFKGGYQKTRIADGEEAIDLMDRTAGREGWYVVRPFPTIPSNCVLPGNVLAQSAHNYNGNINALGMGYDSNYWCVYTYYGGVDPITGFAYDPTITDYSQAPKLGGGVLGPDFADYLGFNPFDPELNGGRGFPKQLGGNELPNAPNYTATLTADYTRPLAGDWLMNLHADFHWQSKSWWRIFNDHEYGRLDEFYTVNLAAIFTNDDAGWKVMAYVKNVFDETALTGAFLNSDDTGLTTNVFLTEPRLYGLRVTKDWTGMSGFWGFGDGSRRPVGEPYPFTVEFGGGVGRHSGETEAYAPDWIDLYSPTFPLDQSFQDEDLDWGDTRAVKLTYAPTADWRIAAAYRFGKTNGFAKATPGYEEVAGGLTAGLFYPAAPPFYSGESDNHWRAAVHDSEEHAITDFMVGKDIGFGALGGGKSWVSGGLRHADFQSISSVTMDGIPNRVVPAIAFPFNPLLPQRTRTHFTTTLDSDRSFEGVGPSVSWESSLRLAGDEESGHADLDWSVTGGVLFGKQTVESEETRLAQAYVGFNNPTNPYDDVVPRSRTEDVTVPNLSLTLGVSYEIDRVKVSTGYSYDRFFNAIDGGYEEAQTYDRTIHGPYLKLSLGFGG